MGLVLRKQDAEKFIRLNQELIFKDLFNNKLKYKIFEKNLEVDLFLPIFLHPIFLP